MNMYSWNEYSESAKTLATALGIKRIKHTNSKFKGKPNKVVVNWGSSSLPDEVMKCRILNRPEFVNRASNKKLFFEYMSQYNLHCVVEHTCDPDVALKWYEDNITVVAREVLQGHSGEGIHLLKLNETGFIEAPLYTKYKPKKDEYRLAYHRNRDGSVLCFSSQRKARSLAVPEEEVNWKIRNYANGFIYQREDLAIPNCVFDCGFETFAISGLDFGAIDIIYNEREQRAYALEINTAPGLDGSTVNEYASMLRSLLY